MTTSEKVIESAELAYEDSLNLFNVPTSNLGVTDVKFLKYKPINQFTSEGAVRFYVPGVGPSYIDLSGATLKTVVRILRSDGSPIPKRNKAGGSQPSTTTKRAASATDGTGATISSTSEQTSSADKEDIHDASTDSTDSTASADTSEDEGIWSISTCNHLAQSLWDSIEIKMNDRVMTHGQTRYSYMSMLNTLLCESKMNESDLECSFFYKDTAGYLDDTSLSAAGGNEGLKKRAELLSESKPVELLAKIEVDVLKNSKKYLLNGVSLAIHLTPTDNKFRLLTCNGKTKDYKLVIEDISLILPHVTPANHVLLAHQDVLKSELSRAKYFYIKEELRSFNLAKGSSSYHLEDAFNGRLPQKILLAFVDGAAIAGSLSRNPYNFKHNFLSFINISESGNPSPRGAIYLDFERGEYLQSYKQLYEGKTCDALSSARIKREDFPNGYSIFRIDLAPQDGKEFYPINKQGCCRIELRFDKPLAESVVMLAKVEYPGLYELDFSRNIFVS